ncbi:sucrose-6-phosphate hydrolase [Bacillus kwashiorkori]|uniref:sucrose-6-phosphate hydrolase n=1 Tax=Bacillus kwashiorkori TaxID=1522318 RepID=UPI0007809D6C|nr:sucrose-6-phosphate hydrolase [Bacillus kwashiorkori]
MEKEVQQREKITRLLDDYQKREIADPYRLKFHLTPRIGLLNDPNGLIQFNNRYHVFFQWNPFATDHTYKCWGHYSTKDFITWQEHPPALLPDEWYDKNGCYSGSAVEHNGKLYLFYTGNVKNEAGDRETYQCMAVSEDGIHFEKKGPIIYLPDGYTAHFRDPKVWKEEDYWYMVLGAQTKDEMGVAVLYRSANFNDWEFLGEIAGSNKNELGMFGYMWECPDLFHLDDKEVLIVSPQGLAADGYQYQNLFQSGYFIGNWNQSNHQFYHGEFTELDRGFDFYAPQTFEDKHGRRILYAWMGMADGTEPYHQSVKSGWIHSLTIPRQLKMKNNHLYQQPLEELKKLRTSEKTHLLHLSQEEQQLSLTSPCQEIFMDIELEGSLSIVISPECQIVYDGSSIIVDRISFSSENRETRQVPLNKLRNLHLFLDHSSLELFINDGEEVFTLRFYPTEIVNKLIFSTDNEIKLKAQCWELDELKWMLNNE